MASQLFCLVPPSIGFAHATLKDSPAYEAAFCHSRRFTTHYCPFLRVRRCLRCFQPCQASFLQSMLYDTCTSSFSPKDIGCTGKLGWDFGLGLIAALGKRQDSRHPRTVVKSLIASESSIAWSLFRICRQAKSFALMRLSQEWSPAQVNGLKTRPLHKSQRTRHPPMFTLYIERGQV